MANQLYVNSGREFLPKLLALFLILLISGDPEHLLRLVHREELIGVVALLAIEPL
jgi:hypothetical protein